METLPIGPLGIDLFVLLGGKIDFVTQNFSFRENIEPIVLTVEIKRYDANVINFIHVHVIFYLFLNGAIL